MGPIHDLCCTEYGASIYFGLTKPSCRSTRANLVGGSLDDIERYYFVYKECAKHFLTWPRLDNSFHGPPSFSTENELLYFVAPILSLFFFFSFSFFGHCPTSTTMSSSEIDEKKDAVIQAKTESLAVLHQEDGQGPTITTYGDGAITTSGNAVNPFLIFACVTFAAASFLFGYDDKVISPIIALEPFVRCAPLDRISPDILANILSSG